MVLLSYHEVVVSGHLDGPFLWKVNRTVTREPERKIPSFVSRHFWVVLCGLFLLLYVPLMAREWFALRSEGLHDIERYSTSLAQLLERDLGLYAPLPEVLSKLDDSKNFNYLDDNLRQKIGFLGLQKVKVFTRDGVVLYPRTPGVVNKKLGDNFRTALGGKIISKIITRDAYRQEYGQDVATDLAEVYLPIRDWEGKVQFVMETYYETSEILRRNRRLLWQHSMTLAAFLAALLAVGGYFYRSRQSLEKKVEILESILPICMHCKKIRVERPGEPNRWVAVETFFHQKGEVEFSHGVCDDCLKIHYPGFEDPGHDGRNPGA